MFIFIMFLIFVVLLAVALARFLFLSASYILASLQKRTNPKLSARLKKSVVFFAVASVLIMGLIALSQAIASTPSIDTENGISELVKLELNGRKQWISIRGTDKNAPFCFFGGRPAGPNGGGTPRAGRVGKAFRRGQLGPAGSESPITLQNEKHDARNLYPRRPCFDGILKGTFFEKQDLSYGRILGQRLGNLLGRSLPRILPAFIGTGKWSHLQRPNESII